MANQITHIVLAKKMGEEFLNKFDQSAFLVGTIFPDVRYLKVVDREKTHFNGLSLKDVLDEKNSFIAGMKYHSLVDEVREKYLVDRNIYSLIPSSRFITQALKIYEDEVLYSNVSDWDQVIAFLGRELNEEIELVEQIDKVKAWYLILQKYFKKEPTDESRKDFILGVGFSEEIAAEINSLISTMRQTPEVREIILNLYQDWGSLVTTKKADLVPHDEEYALIINNK
mgnify:CR=1 FL=1